MNTTITLWVTIAAGVFGVLGIGCVVLALRLVLVADDSRTWRTATGELIETRVVMRPVKVRSGAMRVTVKELYHVQVRYAYRVEGQEYTGDRFRVGETQMSVPSHREGERITSAIKSTPDLTVYYDPENPESSALQRGGSSFQILGLLAIGLVLVILAVAAFIFLKR